MEPKSDEEKRSNNIEIMTTREMRLALNFLSGAVPEWFDRAYDLTQEVYKVSADGR
jgi:hypothetical protein